MMTIAGVGQASGGVRAADGASRCGWTALSVLLLLLGCGDSDDSAGGSRAAHYPSEPHTLHLALSNDFLHGDEEYRLHLAGREYDVLRHDDESRQRHPDIFATARHGLSELPTHYAPEIPLPTDSISRFHVTQHSDRGGRLADAHGDVSHGLSMVGVHVPHAARRASAERNAGDPGSAALSGISGSDTSNCLAGSNVLDNNGDISVDLLNTYGPLDIAKAYLFHHPEVTNFAPDLAADILDKHIACAEGLQQFAATIKSINRSTGSWYDMQPVLAEDGTQHTTQSGQPLYSYVIKDAVKTAAVDSLKNTINAIKNDPSLKGENWNTQDGVASVDDSASSAAALSGTSEQAFKVRLASVGNVHGLDVNLVSADDTRTVKVSADNNNLTHLGWYVRFLDADEKVLSDSEYTWEAKGRDFLPDELVELLEDSENKFLSIIEPVQTIVGIPYFSDDNRTEISFQIPQQATYAELRAGGLGTGHRDPTVTTMGITMTSIFELGVPTMLLAAAAGYHDDGAGLRKLFTRATVIKLALNFFASSIYFSGSGDMSDLAERVGVLMGSFILSKFGQSVFEYYIEQMTLEEIDDGIPFAGWTLNAISIATTVTMLAESSSEVASVPWVIERRLTSTHDIDVVVHHDPNNFQFPATATEFKVLATFSGGTPHVKTVTLPGTTVSDPQTVRFTDVPAGGKVDIHVLFFSDTGWLAGRGDVVGITNLNSPGLTHLEVPVTIEERLVPLWDESVYVHREVLAYDASDGHHWVAAHDDPPAQTIRDLANTATQGAMGELGNVTLSQKLGTLGYAWRAYSPSVMPCPGQAAAEQLYVFQNISLTEHPDDGFMFANCGFSDKPYVLYDLLGDETNGRNFVVVPGADGMYYAREMTYTTTGTFDLSTTESFAKFPFRVDSMVYHPRGYLIAINDSSSRMFSARIGEQPVMDAQAPVALAVAGPATTIQGAMANPDLLRDPISVKLAPDHAVMILDDIHELTEGTSTAQTKARIKVFNTDGTPVPYFAGGAHQLDIVETDMDVDVFYLDFAVESRGYVYVLSYATPQNDPNHVLTSADYRLDLYEPDGTFLARTTGIAAARIAVDVWRNVNTLNYQTIVGPQGRIEPSVSEWIPPTPKEQGESCDVDVACVSNHCDSGVCAGLPNGQPCIMDIDCTSQICDRAMCSATRG